METNEGFIQFIGYLWELIGNTKSEDISEPSYPVGPMDMVLGPMLRIEKILFTLREELFSGLILLFNIDVKNPEAILEFYTWLFTTKREGFIARCQKENHDVTLFLETRKQFFDTHDFLTIVTAQHFNIDREEFIFYYRKGSLVSIQKIDLFKTKDN